MGEQVEMIVKLPAPSTRGSMSLEQALSGRRSVRSYSGKQVSLENLGQLLWSAQGCSDKEGHRTAPSAGALYPLELYAVVGAVSGLEAGLYHYAPADRALSKRMNGDLRQQVARISLEQMWISGASWLAVFCAVTQRVTEKYGPDSRRFVDMEAGHAAQNLMLQAVALGMDTCVVGAFKADQLRKVLQIPQPQLPLLIVPVGYSELS
ncbi:MAG: SagB/ThcOx family dehydrogenase [Phycisphaeraceae bacterium]|nr:SagB/ThcOx family dehydrogenase [Phycisphaeraceae bacterium]